MVSREEKNKKIAEKIKEEEKLEKKKKRRKKILIFIFILLSIISFTLLYMRFIGTKGLIVREYKIVNEKLPEEFHGFKIAHFSDLHYLSSFDKNDLKKLITKINELKPDIVVFTGDLTDSDTEITNNDLDDIKNLLNKIKVTTGLYAIKGNHDYGNNNFEIVFNQTNFKILNNTYDLIYYHGSIPILITGIGSTIQNDYDIGSAYSYNEMDSLFTISLLHEADVLDDIISSNKVDLALAGHSHNGQIRLPFIGALKTIEGSKKYYNEYYKVNNTDLYVSGGLGSSLFKLRFFNHPSINFYRLVEK